MGNYTIWNLIHSAIKLYWVKKVKELFCGLLFNSSCTKPHTAELQNLHLIHFDKKLKVSHYYMIVENLITCILHCGKFLPSIKFWDFCQINSKTVALLCGKWANVEHVVRFKCTFVTLQYLYHFSLKSLTIPTISCVVPIYEIFCGVSSPAHVYVLFLL